jgi:CRP/FNR family cyclic AMP-dependent transcriptional regulator
MPSIDGRAHAHVPSLRDVFDRGSLANTRMRVDAQKPVYASGDTDDSMYLIESGQVKLSMSSAEGKDCLLAIYAAGEIFGETCFTGRDKRFESATAMQPTVLRRATRRDFVAALERASAMELLLHHLASRLAERQFAVFDLATANSEQRLAKVLLAFAEKHGTADGPFLRVSRRVSHEALSQIVGTTRPRISEFMKRFRQLALVEISGRSISVHQQKMRDFVAGE